MPSTPIITFAIQKGGASKSTSAAITAYLLARKGYHVLAVDMDSQGNLTSLLSGVDTIYSFRNATILEAMQDHEATGQSLFEDYVHQTNDHIHLLPAEDLLSLFPRWIYSDFVRENPLKLNPGLILRKTLHKLLEFHPYDFVIIDTPPHLGDQTINSLAATTHVITMFEPSKFCFDALPTFFQTIDIVKRDLNPQLQPLGILCTIIDARRSDSKMFLETLQSNDYFGSLLFNTVIHRKATTGRVSLYGFEDNVELESAIEDYQKFVEEMLSKL
nr:ParA family protein [Fredinandcohnia onubensis]